MAKEKKKLKPGTLVDCGLWARVSTKTGETYYSNLVEIAGQDYWVNIFKNKSDNPQAPTLNLLVRKAEPKGAAKEKEKDDIPF